MSGVEERETTTVSEWCVEAEKDVVVVHVMALVQCMHA